MTGDQTENQQNSIDSRFGLYHVAVVTVKFSTQSDQPCIELPKFDIFFSVFPILFCKVRER